MVWKVFMLFAYTFIYIQLNSCTFTSTFTASFGTQVIIFVIVDSAICLLFFFFIRRVLHFFQHQIESHVHRLQPIPMKRANIRKQFMAATIHCKATYVVWSTLLPNMRTYRRSTFIQHFIQSNPFVNMLCHVRIHTVCLYFARIFLCMCVRYLMYNTIAMATIFYSVYNAKWFLHQIDIRLRWLFENAFPH